MVAGERLLAPRGTDFPSTGLTRPKEAAGITEPNLGAKGFDMLNGLLMSDDGAIFWLTCWPGLASGSSACKLLLQWCG